MTKFRFDQTPKNANFPLEQLFNLSHCSLIEQKILLANEWNLVGHVKVEMKNDSMKRKQFYEEEKCSHILQFQSHKIPFQWLRTFHFILHVSLLCHSRLHGVSVEHLISVEKSKYFRNTV